MPESNGIIHSFQQRRQLEQDLAGPGRHQLADGIDAGRPAPGRAVQRRRPPGRRHAPSGHEQQPAARRPGPVECVAAASKRRRRHCGAVAGNRGKTPQERTTAALILDRYLEQPAASGFDGRPGRRRRSALPEPARGSRGGQSRIVTCCWNMSRRCRNIRSTPHSWCCG